MPLSRRKASVLGATFFGLFVVATWMHRGDQNGPKILIPTERFWRQTVLIKSFWNREQQLLDFMSNAVLNSARSVGDSVIQRPDWLNGTGPLDSCEPDQRVPTQVPDYNTLPQRFQDFLLHMRCRSYPLLINQPHVCDGHPFLLLVVKSLTPHFDRRQAIRETWGRAGVLANHTVAAVFLLGNSVPSDHQPDLQELLRHEAELHRDVLQWDYRDTFLNLTVKEVLFLRWFKQHCPHARFVLKGDDDVFVNTPMVMELLQNTSASRVEDFFIGDVIRNASPVRNLKLKYSVPESVFVGSYPPYAGGGGFLYSGELASRLYAASQQVALYPIDDVYVGMCLQKLGLVPQKHSGFRTFGINPKHRDNPCVYRGLMLVHSLTPQELLSIWPWISRPELDCQ